MTERFTQNAVELLEKYQGGTFPLPLIEIANELGISVFSSSEYPVEKNGHIQLNEDGTVSIIVNNNQPYARKRFTIAHEIAHFLMDMDYLRQHKSIDRDGDAADASYREREKRANAFAAELLMPEKEFVRQWLAVSNIETVADVFGVSKEAALWRAVNIGLVSAE